MHTLLKAFGWDVFAEVWNPEVGLFDTGHWMLGHEAVEAESGGGWEAWVGPFHVIAQPIATGLLKAL